MFNPFLEKHDRQIPDMHVALRLGSGQLHPRQPLGRGNDDVFTGFLERSSPRISESRHQLDSSIVANLRLMGSPRWRLRDER